MGNPFVIPSVFTAIDKFSGPMKAMGAAVNGFVGRTERLLGRANKAFASLMTPITSLNKMLMGLGYYIGLFTLIRVLRDAINVMADFEQANADLGAVLKGDATSAELKAMSKDARAVGLTYGVAATEVVKMQHALATLGFKPTEILMMAKPMMAGSSALEGADPQRLAETVGAVINTFDNLGAGDTSRILNVMAKAANETALDFDKLATTLPIVSGPANALNISFERQVALLGILQNAGVHVATSATSLKNIFIDSQKKGHTYNQMLENITKNADKLTYAYNKFGKRSVVSALVLAGKLKEIDALEQKLIKAGREKNLIDAIAAQRLDTYRGAQKMLNAAYQEFILTIDDGTGPIAGWLKWLTKVGAATLLLASGSEAAQAALAKMSPFVKEEAERWLWWSKVILKVTAALVALRSLIWIVEIFVKIANGIKWVVALVGGATAAILSVVAAFIAGVIWFTNLYGEWEKRMIALGVDTKIEQMFSRMWNAILGTFIALWNQITTFAAKIPGFFKDVGASIVDFMLTPLELVLQAISQISGAKWAGESLKSIEAFKASISGAEYAPTQPVVNPNAGDQRGDIAEWLNGMITMQINDPGNNVKSVKSDSLMVQPVLSNTNSF